MLQEVGEQSKSWREDGSEAAEQRTILLEEEKEDGEQLQDGEREEDRSEVATRSFLQEDSVLLNAADHALEPGSERKDGEGGVPRMGSTISRLEDRIAESRLRRLATGRRLVPLLSGPDDEGARAFAQACLEVRAELDRVLQEAGADVGRLEEATLEQEAIARDVADLQDNDVRLDALLQKIAKKLDGLTLTLGGA